VARILITGSSESIGLMASELFADADHVVTLHARNEQRAADAQQSLRAAKYVVIDDASCMEAIRQVAEQADTLGLVDAIIHNVGIGYREPNRVSTVDGFWYLDSEGP
jgi:short-subunit dehydrogenase